MAKGQAGQKRLTIRLSTDQQKQVLEARRGMTGAVTTNSKHRIFLMNCRVNYRSGASSLSSGSDFATAPSTWCSLPTTVMSSWK
jgi:hypothetical protein